MTSSFARLPLVASTADERARTTIAMPTRMTAGMTVQMISRRVAVDLRALGALRPCRAAEADDEEDERGLDGDEDDRADGEDEPVELVDGLAARSRRLGRPEAAGPGSCQRDRCRAERERRERGGDDGGRFLRIAAAILFGLPGRWASPRMSPFGELQSPKCGSVSASEAPLSGEVPVGTAGSWERFSRAEGEIAWGNPVSPKTPLSLVFALCQRTRGSSRCPPT